MVTIDLSVDDVGDDDDGKTSVVFSGAGGDGRSEVFVDRHLARWFAERLYQTIRISFEGADEVAAPKGGG